MMTKPPARTGLASLLDARKTLNAPVVFGPVIAQLPDPLTRGVRAAYTQRLYSRLGSSDTQVIDKPHGCGNALFDREAQDLPSPVFDQAANEIGGEDDIAVSETAGSERPLWLGGASRCL